MEMLTAHGVFTEPELKSRCEIMLENYCKTVIIEAKTMTDMARTMIAPAVEKYTCAVAKAAGAKKTLLADLPCRYEADLVKKLSGLLDEISAKTAELEDALLRIGQTDDIISEAEMIRDTVLPKMSELRVPCDEAEVMTAKDYWPFPTYADLLFGTK